MSKMNGKTARTLLMVTVMIASALMPMVPEAAELRDEAKTMRTAVSTDVSWLGIDEGDWGMYEVTLDQAPNGVLVVTPSSDNAGVTVDPAYLKFTKVNWDQSQYIYVDVEGPDDDGADTTATISHALSGTDTVFSGISIGDVSITGTDYDTDTDGDGLHDGIDDDDDDDQTDDANDAFPLDDTEDTDTDGDGTGDNADTDDDDDGTDDASDAFPLDDTEDTDTDGDGTGDNADTDDDGDGVDDASEDAGCELIQDCDGDGTTDDTDDFPSDANETTDSDGDGVGDNSDAFPNDDTEDTDTDGDGTGDNADDFPSDANETTDTDGDGVGDNADDFDNDDTEDTDTDGDGTGDNSDAFPTDDTEDTDTDGDGTGDNADTDDDGDGVDDSNEESGCDLDADCDGDGVGDATDDFPLDANATTDTDGDGDADEISVTGAVYDFDFEGGTLPTYVTWELSQCDGSDSACTDANNGEDWSVSDWNPIDGTYSLRSGNLSTNYQNLNISVTFTSDAGTMSFDYQISSLCRDYVSTYYDGFRLYVDGVQVDNPSDGGTACENGVWGGADAYDTSHPAYSASYFVCADGSNGFSISYVPSWLGDGWNDCSDGSDEDASYYTGLALANPAPVSGSHEQALSAGTHTVIFQFHGGTSSAAGDSIAWIDNLVIPVPAGTSGSQGPTTTTDGTALDTDDDDDGYSDEDETINCVGGLSDPLDATDFPMNDNDADYLCDAVDTDDDNDGVLDVNEADGSGIGANGADVDCTMTDDCDGDTYTDDVDTHPTDSTEWADMDGDGFGDNSDDDRDGDGYLNSNDEFPDDDTEWADNDGDGTGDNADTDDDTCPAADGADTDNDGTADATCGTYTGPGSSSYDYYPGDGVLDVDDAFPNTPAETADNDGDGWGDNADYDDDNDGIGDPQDDDMDGDGFDNDDEDTNCVGDGGDSTTSTITPDDMDGDGVCDYLDVDTDGDGTNNTDQGDGAADAFPEDACADTDTDGDGMPDTIVAGCTSTLTEDDDDDFDASNAPTYDFYIWIDTDSWYSEASVGVYDYSSGSATTLLAAFYPSGSSMELLGTVTATDDIAVYGFDSWGDGFGYVYVADANANILGTITVSGSSAGAAFLFSDYVSSTVWDDAAEVACGSDPADANDQPTDTDGDNLCDDVQDDDNDGDGWSNADEETNCAESNDAEDASDEPTDTDGDDICNELDSDDDGDGVDDASDAFPLDSTETIDTDGDGTGDNADTDDDGDQTDDASDAFPLDSTETTDTDGDGIGDNADTDDDGDGTDDASDAFPLDDTEDTDTDGDGTGDNADTDDDGDNVDDANDACPLDIDESVDTDGDGVCDGDDDDDDGDGVDDVDEADGSGLSTATDCTLVADCDGDGVDDVNEDDGCAADTDCDDDGTTDDADAFPSDASEDTDTDGDGTGDNADTDDDGDGYSDADETTNCDDGGSYASSSDPLDSSDTPDDMDGDGVCDALDGDRDGDFLANDWDGCPDDASGYTDTDGDGLCDESDTDDDADGYDDANDAFPLDDSEWTDTDGDGIGDNGDADDDDDGTDDQGDECPLDASGITDNDGDGVCDVTDTDDDDDGVLDADEEYGCDMVADCDGDGANDDADAFPTDDDAVLDTDGDGLADDFLASTTSTSTTWNITTQSNNALTVMVYDEDGGVLCELTTNAGGTTAAGTDTANAQASCQVTAGSISIEAVGTDYYTYYGAYFGNWEPNVCVEESVTGGSAETCWNAQYQWYYDNYFGNPYYLGSFYTLNAEGTGLDFDDDDDGYSDAHESASSSDYCGSGDPLDDTVTPDDNDVDLICDTNDDDDDDDGYSDAHEVNDCGTDPFTSYDVDDFDGDGICDIADDDADGDGTDNDDDWRPYNSAEWADTDGDGTGDNEDDDADGDGWLDSDDVDITDRCSSVDTDGDGLTDDYNDCSSIGFHTSINKDEGDNAGDGFSDGGMLGITDEWALFGYSDGQYYVVSDTDGVFRWVSDSAEGVASISLDFAMSTTDWEPEDWYRAYWVDDNGTTTELFNSSEAPDGDIDNIGLEGYWFSWATEVPGDGDGHFLGMMSTDDPDETFGFDNLAFWDGDGELIGIAHMEDPVENLGGWYQAPGDPISGTYTIDIADSWGDGGHGITATMNGVTLCTIGQYAYSTGTSCTFDVEANPGDTLEIDVDTDSWASEGSMTVTFNDGTTATETWSADTTFSYSHVGAPVYAQEGTYTVTISDPGWGDGGHDVEVYFDGDSVCSIASVSGAATDSCTFTVTGYSDAVLDVVIDSDSWPQEGQLDVTFPDGTTATETWTADTTFSYTQHSGTDVVPQAGEIDLSNGWGATVNIDTSAYYSGTVDDDDDNDGVLDEDDAFPLDDGEWDDLDGDGLGSNDDDDDDDGDGIPDHQDDFPRHAQASTDTDGDGMPDWIDWVSGDFVDDFEAGNFSGFDTDSDDVADTAWTRSGDANWGITSWDVAASGYGAKSGTIDHNESSTLEVSLETVDGWYSFHWATDTEERYDELTFSIDGSEVASFSGRDDGGYFECVIAGSYGDRIPGNWVNDGYDDCGDDDANGIADDEEVASSWYQPSEGHFEGWVDAGTHTFTWTYSKDDTDSYDANQDKVLIDDVVIPGLVEGEGECSDGTDLCNEEDMDDDNDGLDDISDACPTDAGEGVDSDGDGICDNQDADDDNDGVYDYNDAMPLDPNEQYDADGDGIGDNADDDDDNDGCTDDQDDLPYDDSDCVDTDGDGVGNTADPDDDGDNVMDDVDPFPLDGEAWIDTDGDGDPDYTGDPPFLGNFEGGSIPAGWTTYGDAPWHVCGMGSCLNPTGNAINGTYMGENGDINDGQTSSLEVTMDTLAGGYSFAYETSTEGFWDYLRFYVDGSLTMSWSGVTSGTYTGTVSAGYHTFQWMYYKDGSVSSNADSVWVDDIVLPVSQVVNQSDLDDDNDGVMDDYDMAPTDPCVGVDTDGDGMPDWVVEGVVDMSGNGDAAFMVDCDASSWLEDWDDDGDGWSDFDEWICGSNGLDADESPSDGDNDWICDAVDDDLDNDGYINPIDCEVYMASEDLDGFLDCLEDNFNGADSNDDGEVDVFELAIYFGVGDGGEGITYICGDGSEIPFEWVNDGVDDCPLGADEQQYDDAGNKTNWFDCFDGSEIWMDQVNDGMDDCLGGEDEYHEDEYSSGISEEEFNATWGYVLMFDADNSSTINFDEYWALNNANGELDDLGLVNPGWDGDDTEWDQFPMDASEHVDSDGDGIGDNEDPDDDNDGVTDGLDAFPYDPTEWDDLDEDGIGDNSDNDTDGDGIDNEFDQFDQDPTTSADNDGDGADDGSDADDDNDGVPDVSDWAPMDPTEQYDTDGDGTGDNADTDDDTCPTADACNEGYFPGDEIPDVDDAFPLDPSESSDSDGDGVGDNADPDDDNDGVPDGLDAFPYDGTETRDTDLDSVGDNADNDDDGDGVDDADDEYPLNPNEWEDTDEDNIGNNADTDDDGDTYADPACWDGTQTGAIDCAVNDEDRFPLDDTEWADTDGDGLGDNHGDDDDDNDGVADTVENTCGSNSLDPNSMPSDYDGDGECDATDLTPVGDRSNAADGQETPGFTPGFPAVLAAISLLGAALQGRRKDD